LTTKIYWSCLEDEWLRASEPENVYASFHSKFSVDKSDLNSHPFFCPAFKNQLSNVFSVKSIYTYNFEMQEDSVTSSLYDQTFFDKHIEVRSLESKLFGFKNWFSFFSEEESLTVSQEHPFLEDNNITKNCITVPGQFDIAKWYRTMHYAFYLKKESKTFSVDEGEILYYLRFHTKEKVKFIQYRQSDKLNDLLDDVQNSRNFLGIKGLDYYYKLMKIKKTVLKEIKKNIVE
jgi:hypothetical protein